MLSKTTLDFCQISNKAFYIKRFSIYCKNYKIGLPDLIRPPLAGLRLPGPGGGVVAHRGGGLGGRGRTALTVVAWGSGVRGQGSGVSVWFLYL